MRGLKILLLGLALAFCFGLVAKAQVPGEVEMDENVQVKDLEISEAKILSDNPFYFLKSWARALRLFFTFNPEKKTGLRLKIANEKLIEARKLTELKKDPRLIEKTLDGFQNEIKKISEAGQENLKKFSEKLIHQEILHQKILEKLETQVPPEVLEKIRAQREKHLESFAQVVQKIEEKEKIPERLAVQMEKMAGSRFKAFRNLEILKNLAEKMPGEIKKKIQEREEKIIEDFYQSLERMPVEDLEKFKEYTEKVSGDKERYLEILGSIQAEAMSEKLKTVMKEIEKEKIEAMEKQKMSGEKAETQIEIAGAEIEKAKEAVKRIGLEEYKGRAVRELLGIGENHLKEARKAFDNDKYGKAWGLATSAYHLALNVERIISEIEELKERPEEWKKKFKELYPEVSPPENIKKCKIPERPLCPAGKIAMESDANGCLVFKCQPIKREMEEQKSVPPDVCVMIWDPVCGLDGKTYSNECVASQIAKVEIAYKGICKEKRPEASQKPKEIQPSPKISTF